MAERDRIRLLAALATAPWSVRAAASAPGTDAPLLAIMRRVFDNDLPGALAAARLLATAGGHPDAHRLVTELADMARGGYATEGNRAFVRFRPLWQRALSVWLAERWPPANRLPSNVLSLAPGTGSVLAVDLEESAAWLVPAEGVAPGDVEAFYISSGVAGPGKRRYGDKRTPVGVYWAVDDLDAERLPARYGSRVMPLDYPNALDRSQRRTGDGIWIHGIDPANNVRPPRDTDGCIAFTEDRVNALADGVRQRVTPVVVASRLDWHEPGRRGDEVTALDGALAEWLTSWRARDADRFIALYADEFKGMGMSPQLWRSWRRRMLESGPVPGVDIASVSHFVADADAGVYLTRCRQSLQPADGGERVVTWLRLYWQEQKGRLRVVAQSAG